MEMKTVTFETNDLDCYFAIRHVPGTNKFRLYRCGFKNEKDHLIKQASFLTCYYIMSKIVNSNNWMQC